LSDLSEDLSVSYFDNYSDSTRGRIQAILKNIFARDNFDLRVVSGVLDLFEVFEIKKR